MAVFPFTLSFSGGPAARFPFVMDGLPAEGISCAISSRSAGDMVYSAGEANPARDALYRFLGLESRRVFSCTQVHSRDVLVVDRDSPNGGPRGDGMVSRDPLVCLSVTVADCLPVFLLDTEGGAFGLVHSGWKGTGIALRALELMGERWKVRPEAVAAILGPCIGPCCYRVEEERARAFEAEFGGEGPLGPVTREAPDPGEAGEKGRAFFLDLRAANARLLAAAGVRNIAVCGDCTFTDQRLGSFRREGVRDNPGGPPVYTRMAALIGRF
jgi:YfiH family protein